MEGYETGAYSDRIQEKFRRIFDPKIEGIHMYANGYQVVLDNLKAYL
jgi:hypothetical protein